MENLAGSTPWMPRPFAGVRRYLAALWHEVTRDAVRPYRPEQHYMRGPGPAWHAKHGIKSQG
jgi:hypothetical protein